jgi:two-component system, response regulator
MGSDCTLEILLIEGNPAEAQRTIHSLLRFQAASRITWFAKGAEALDFLFAHGRFQARPMTKLPGVILLDATLPQGSSREVLRQIKSEPDTYAIPVVMLVSPSVEQAIAETFRADAQGCLAKPVSLDKVSAVLASLIRPGHVTRADHSSSDVTQFAGEWSPG